MPKKMTARFLLEDIQAIAKKLSQRFFVRKMLTAILR